jgi:hypothetical protein
MENVVSSKEFGVPGRGVKRLEVKMVAAIALTSN